ncbi:5394_t:CDS:2, partial [Funneliformis mosseae]
EGTYVIDVIVPLFRATLEDLPSGHICLSTAERQSLTSKALNKSLLTRALEQAISNPPQNVYPSPTVSTPSYNN